MDNLGRDMERMMWALLIGGFLAGGAVAYGIQHVGRLLGWWR